MCYSYFGLVVAEKTLLMCVCMLFVLVGLQLSSVP